MSEKFDQWALVEVMGHKRFAGRVSEQEIAGHGFVRVDIPETPGCQPFTKLFAPASLYAITPIDETAARLMAEQFRERPVSVWELPQLPAPMPGHHRPEPDEFDDPNEDEGPENDEDNEPCF